MATRACRFSLSFQDDSVFADFDVDHNGCVFLLWISFDGYGCCCTEGKVGVMNPEDSRNLIDSVEQDDVDREETRAILCKYFQVNSHVIWRDALEEHALLRE